MPERVLHTMSFSPAFCYPNALTVGQDKRRWILGEPRTTWLVRGKRATVAYGMNLLRM